MVPSRVATKPLDSERSTPRPGRLLWIVVTVVILLVGIVRVRLLDVPLERDEGEYAYTGQLMLEGIPPYRLASNMKLPGTAAAYALILAVFGQTPTGIHWGFLVVNAAAVGLVYLLGKRLFHAAAGLAAGASYALLSVGVGVLGTAAHATHFVLLPALAGTLLLLRWTDSRRRITLFWSGLLYGIAFVMKQPGVFFAAFGVFYLIWNHHRSPSRTSWRGILLPLGLFVFAASLPLVVTCLILWRAGVFEKFWFWTFTYAGAYGSMVPLARAIGNLAARVPKLVYPNWAVWFLAAAGLALLWRKKENRGSALFTTAFLVFSFFAVCPGFYFREHYFVLLLPAIALLAGAAGACPWKVPPHAFPLWLFAGALGVSVVQQREFLFRMSAWQVSRHVYGLNPFPEALSVATYIRDRSSPDSRIAVLGSEPEIYFYARRHSATSYIYTYPLMEPQPFALQMQNEFIQDLETVRPEYVVMVNVDLSWLKRKTSPARLLEWWTDYGPKHYELVGVADIISQDETRYRWDAAAATYRPRSPSHLLVLRRRTQ